MSKVKFYVVVVFLCKISSSSCDEKHDKTTEILFNLTNYAIESRRIRNVCIHETSDAEYFACMKRLTQNGLVQYPPNYGFNYHPKPQNFIPYPQRPYGNPFRPSYQNPQSIMDVLYTISRNDALRCVPRLLCEVTSDTISRGRQGFNLPALPFNVDMQSIIRLLATIDFPGGSPVAYFGKAALLGYVSKGNSDSCLDAYPTCPRDANKLIQYLNNYNGGFFRYFNGLNTKPTQNYHHNYGLINYPSSHPYKNFAQERIQNRPVDNGVIFAHNDVSGDFRTRDRGPKQLTFPSEDNNRFNEFVLKKPKELPFSISDYHFNELDLQRPLPNHKATPIIFPVRTGTGELRLDAEELDLNKHKHQNNFVSFRPEEGFYYEGPEALPSGELASNKAVFSFPV